MTFIYCFLFISLDGAKWHKCLFGGKMKRKQCFTPIQNGGDGKRHKWEKAYMGKGIYGKRHKW